MKLSSFNLRRIMAGVLMLVTLFAGVSYYFDLGFFGQRAKGLLILSIGLAVLYGAFLAPTRKEMDEYGKSRKAYKDR
jgi:hypothetical protein